MNWSLVLSLIVILEATSWEERSVLLYLVSSTCFMYSCSTGFFQLVKLCRSVFNHTRYFLGFAPLSFLVWTRTKSFKIYNINIDPCLVVLVVNTCAACGRGRVPSRCSDNGSSTGFFVLKSRFVDLSYTYQVFDLRNVQLLLGMFFYKKMQPLRS
jgi:hypothetical protein